MFRCGVRLTHLYNVRDANAGRNMQTGWLVRLVDQQFAGIMSKLTLVVQADEPKVLRCGLRASQLTFDLMSCWHGAEPP